MPKCDNFQWDKALDNSHSRINDVWKGMETAVQFGNLETAAKLGLLGMQVAFEESFLDLRIEATKWFAWFERQWDKVNLFIQFGMKGLEKSTRLAGELLGANPDPNETEHWKMMRESLKFVAGPLLMAVPAGGGGGPSGKSGFGFPDLPSGGKTILEKQIDRMIAETNTHREELGRMLAAQDRQRYFATIRAEGDKPFSDGIKDLPKGLDKMMAEVGKKLDVQGTFSGSLLSQLGANSAAERTARNTSDMSKRLKDIEGLLEEAALNDGEFQ